MGIQTGIIFAIIALVCWGFGDFFIQRSTRRFGDWETLIVITLFGLVVLTPFVWSDIPRLLTFGKEFWILMMGSCILLVASIFDFEALKEGKLAIVEPVLAFEIPFSVLLAFLVLRESLARAEIALIGGIMIGLVLISFKHSKFSRRMLFEKGVLLGIGGAIFMGASNFVVGYGSRITDPLLMNWFINVVLAIISVVYLLCAGSLRRVMHDFWKYPKFIFSVCILDNAAWIAYAFAASLSPIGIVVGISESYIIISVILGMIVNKEKIHMHQKIGIAVSVVSVVILAAVVG